MEEPLVAFWQLSHQYQPIATYNKTMRDDASREPGVQVRPRSVQTGHIVLTGAGGGTSECTNQ